MTGQLRTTLRDRADHLNAWDVDLDAIVRDGARRVRHRRVALAGGVAGALAVVGGVSALAVQHLNRPAPADQDAKPLTYAVGNVIHSGDSQVDVGMHVDSFVRLTDRFVFTHDQHVYEARDGRVHMLGPLADPSTPLVAGEDGQKAGWFGLSARYGAGLEIYPGYPQVGDRPNSSFADYPDGWPEHSPPRVQATWGDFLWVSTGVFSLVIYHDPPDGSYEGWRIRSTGPSMIQDAAARRLLVRVGDGMAVVDANLPEHLNPVEASFDNKKDLLPDAPQVPDVSTGDLAPDARHWFTAEAGRFVVYASSDGSAQQPEHAGYQDVTPYQWLSGDTIAALGHRAGDPGGPVSILTCRVSSNTCEAAVDDVAPDADLVVPSGPTTGSR